MLFWQPLANQNNIHQCFCHGYIYTYTKNGVADSVDVETYMNQVENIKDLDHRIIEKERVLEIIKTKPCPKR